jgi:hypothetical protein
MITEGYRFQFDEGVPLRDAEDTLLLSLVAAEGLYGEARVRMDSAYLVDAPLRTIVVDAATDVGQDVCGIFTSFLAREFSPGAFCVRRLGEEVQA